MRAMRAISALFDRLLPHFRALFALSSFAVFQAKRRAAPGLSPPDICVVFDFPSPRTAAKNRVIRTRARKSSVSRSAYALRPADQKFLAALRRHGRRERAIYRPRLFERVRVRPNTCGESRKIRRAERSRFGDGGTDDGAI